MSIVFKVKVVYRVARRIIMLSVASILTFIPVNGTKMEAKEGEPGRTQTVQVERVKQIKQNAMQSNLENVHFISG